MTREFEIMAQTFKTAIAYKSDGLVMFIGEKLTAGCKRLNRQKTALSSPIFLATMIFLSATDSHACTCRSFESVVEVDIKIVSNASPAKILNHQGKTVPAARHTIEPLKIYKGVFNSREVIAHAEFMANSDVLNTCGVTLQVGSIYRIRLPEKDSGALPVIDRCNVIQSWQLPEHQTQKSR